MRASLRSLSLREITDLLSKFRTENTAPLESFLLGLPHQLGRGGSVNSPQWIVSEGRGFKSAPDLDGTYLSGLSGANFHYKKDLDLKVHALFERLGNILADILLRIGKHTY